MKFRFVTYCSFCVLLASCSTYKMYPVCFFDIDPPDDEVRASHVKTLMSLMVTYDTNAISTPDNRWIIANTSSAQHKEITKLWPRMACVGTVTSGTEVKRNSDCVEYLNDFLKNESYLEFDVNDDNVVSSDEAPGQSNTICYRVP